MDLFKAIFAESSEESASSTDESDTESNVPVSADKPDSHPSNTNKLTLNNQSGSKWQDLSVVTSYSVDRNAADMDTSAAISVGIQNYETRNQFDSSESDKQTHQRLETYGPSLPPGIL